MLNTKLYVLIFEQIIPRPLSPRLNLLRHLRIIPKHPIKPLQILYDIVIIHTRLAQLLHLVVDEMRYYSHLYERHYPLSNPPSLRPYLALSKHLFFNSLLDYVFWLQEASFREPVWVLQLAEREGSVLVVLDG